MQTICTAEFDRGRDATAAIVASLPTMLGLVRSAAADVRLEKSNSPQRIQ